MIRKTLTLQTGSLLPYLIFSILCCLLLGLLGLYVLNKYNTEASWWLKVLFFAGPLLFFLFIEDLAGMVIHWIRTRIFKKKYFCPCCGYRSLLHKSPGSTDLCNICGWRDNYWQSTYVDRSDGPNKITLRQCQYRLIKNLEASDKLPDEDRNPFWFKVPFSKEYLRKIEIQSIVIECGSPQEVTRYLRVNVDGSYEHRGFFEESSQRLTCGQNEKIFEELFWAIDDAWLSDWVQFSDMAEINARKDQMLREWDNDIPAKDHPMLSISFVTANGIMADISLADSKDIDAAVVGNFASNYTLTALNILKQQQ